MKLQINGAERNFDGPLSLTSLLEQLGMKIDRVAVELNRQIVPRGEWALTNLNEGDQLEIVHFVGGGSAEGVTLPTARCNPDLCFAPDRGTV